MQAFLYGIYIQWRIDIRNKEALLFYYLVPLLFYGFVGSFFLSIMKDFGFGDTMIVSMSIFGITMGGILGSGIPVCNHYGTALRKAYQVQNIPFWVYAVQNYVSACIHLLLMVSVILVTAPFLFQVYLSISILQFYISMFLYASLCIWISSFLGLIFQTSNKLTMGAQCIFLPSILLSGIMMPADVLDGPFLMISKIIPATWILLWLEGNVTYLYVSLLVLCVLIGMVCLRMHCMKRKD